METKVTYATMLQSSATHDTMSAIGVLSDAEQEVIRAMREPVRGNNFPCLTLVGMPDGKWRLYRAAGGGRWLNGNRKATDGH